MKENWENVFAAPVPRINENFFIQFAHIFFGNAERAKNFIKIQVVVRLLFFRILGIF
jgi:hypothetical protein